MSDFTVNLNLWTPYASGKIVGKDKTAALDAQIFNDGFEYGNFTKTQNGFTWNLGAAYQDPTVETTQPKDGTYSAEFAYPGDGVGNPDSPDSWKELEFSLGAQYSEIWIKYDIFIPSNYVHRTGGAENNKLMYLYNAATTAGSTCYFGFESWPDGSGSYVPLHLKYDGTDYGHDHPGNNYFGQTSDPFPFVVTASDLNKWMTLVFHLKYSTSAVASDGVAEVWKNGTKEMEYLTLDNYSTTNNYFDRGYILGWANSGFANDTTLYVDNFVVSTTNDFGVS